MHWDWWRPGGAHYSLFFGHLSVIFLSLYHLSSQLHCLSFAGFPFQSLKARTLFLALFAAKTLQVSCVHTLIVIRPTGPRPLACQGWRLCKGDVCCFKPPLYTLPPWPCGMILAVVLMWLFLPGFPFSCSLGLPESLPASLDHHYMKFLLLAINNSYSFKALGSIKH